MIDIVLGKTRLLRRCICVTAASYNSMLILFAEGGELRAIAIYCALELIS